MATVTHTPDTGELRLPLDDIHVRENVRDLDADHVDALAQSIALRGLLVPLIVRHTDRGYELVAGYHRIAACRQLGHHDAPVVVRDQEGSSADTASENVVRKQLTALEEARAVQAMLDEGYTLDGAAQALGWTRQLAGARAKILKLPLVAQQLVGSGEIPVSAVENLLTVATASPRWRRASPRRSPPATSTVASSSTTPPGRSGAARRTCPRARSPRTSTSSTPPTARRCASARSSRGSSLRRRRCTSRSRPTPTVRPRSASTSRTPTRRAPPAS